MKFTTAVLLALSFVGFAAPSRASEVKALKITVLSTMLADDGIGEWGFAALVEADGVKILVDTGARPDTVLKNAKELGVDLSRVNEVVLTHFHSDHVGGLLTLRAEMAKQNPEALSVVHVAQGIFYSRPEPGGKEGNPMVAIAKDFKASGGKFIEHDGMAQIAPGMWLTGPVGRVYPEHNWSGSGKVQTPMGLVEDTVPDDQSLIIETKDGLVVVTGCGHAGIANILTAADRQFHRPSMAVIGGLHLFAAKDETVDWTAQKMRGFGVHYLVGAHCTGIEAVFRLREKMGLARTTAVVGAVGSSYSLADGIHPGRLAR